MLAISGFGIAIQQELNKTLELLYVFESTAITSPISLPLDDL